MAAVWRSVCMVTRLALMDGQLAAARARWWARRCSIASRLSWPPVMVGNSGSVGGCGPFGEPGLQDGFGGRDEGCAPFLSAFADGVHVGASAEGDVGAGQRGEFGDPQPGLDGEGEYGVVAATGPAGLVAGGEQRVDLGVGEVGEQVTLGSFGRDREHPLDGGRVFGVPQREVAEQRVDRR